MPTKQLRIFMYRVIYMLHHSPTEHTIGICVFLSGIYMKTEEWQLPSGIPKRTGLNRQRN